MKQRKDGRWLVVKVIDGKQVYFYSTEKTEKQARKDIERQMLSYSSESYRQKHNFKVLAERMLKLQSDGIGYKSIECYKNALKHLSCFDNFDIEDITADMVQNLIDKMSKKQKYSFSSVSKVKTTMGLVLDYAIVHEKIKINNFRKSIKIPQGTKKGKVVAPPDFIRDTIIKNAEVVEFGMWAMCLLCLGLRRGELTALQIKKIDFENDEIMIDDAVEFISNQPHLKGETKNTASTNTVPILNIIKPQLQNMCKDRKPGEFLFGSEKPLTETQIKKRWKKYCETIGYTFKGHQLRHAYAKLLYEAGVDVKTAQRLLRHADFKTTMNIYTEFSDKVTAESVKRLNSYTSQMI